MVNHRESRQVLVKESTQVLNKPERVCEQLDKSSIAELSSSRINGMTCEELVNVIRALSWPSCSAQIFSRAWSFAIARRSDVWPTSPGDVAETRDTD